MPANRQTPWLIAYDIASPKRLMLVHRAVFRAAEPFQYSVFRKTATRRKVVRLMREVEQIIDPRADDVRAYPLLASGRHAICGRSCFPDGVLLLHQPDLFLNNLLADESLLDAVVEGQHRGLPRKRRSPLQVTDKKAEQESMVLFKHLR